MRSRWLTPPVKGALFFCLLITGFSEIETGYGEDKADNPFRFVSYNLRNYLGMSRRSGDTVVEVAPKPQEEIEALVDAIATMRPAILGVCELGGPEYLSDLQERLKAKGIDLPHTELVRSPDGWDRNLALLSRFPIVEKHSRDDLTYEIGDQLLPISRGILDVTIQVTPSYQLRCIGLHLKSKRDVPQADQSQMRLNEALLARKHIDKVWEVSAETNLLVYGDLNCLRIESPVKIIQGGYGNPDYLSSLTVKDSGGERWTHYWDDADVYSRFDYVLYNKALSPEIDRADSYIHHWPDWYKASDHRPIVVSLIPSAR